jgi:hypothetical protein
MCEPFRADCYVVAGGLMAQDDDGFAVVLPTQQRAECKEMPAPTWNAKDTQSNSSDTNWMLSGALGTARPLHVATQHHAEHAKAVFSFAVEVLAIVSRTQLL